MNVKICGITSLEDALFAVRAGANLLGFNFYGPSPRFITPEACAQISAGLRAAGSQAGLVGVFVNMPVAEIEAILDFCSLDLAQCSGDENPADLARLGQRGLKALRPASPQALEDQLPRFPARVCAPAYLLDAYRPGEFGGTGQTADWSLACRLSARSPILLAGGLTEKNVAAAVRQVRPWGVDVASGVEFSAAAGARPGAKDPARVTAFIQAARSALISEPEGKPV